MVGSCLAVGTGAVLLHGALRGWRSKPKPTLEETVKGITTVLALGMGIATVALTLTGRASGGETRATFVKKVVLLGLVLALRAAKGGAPAWPTTRVALVAGAVALWGGVLCKHMVGLTRTRAGNIPAIGFLGGARASVLTGIIPLALSSNIIEVKLAAPLIFLFEYVNITRGCMQKPATTLRALTGQLAATAVGAAGLAIPLLERCGISRNDQIRAGVGIYLGAAVALVLKSPYPGTIAVTSALAAGFLKHLDIRDGSTRQNRAAPRKQTSPLPA